MSLKYFTIISKNIFKYFYSCIVYLKCQNIKLLSLLKSRKSISRKTFSVKYKKQQLRPLN